MLKSLHRYFDFRYYLRFAVIFLLLYYAYIFTVAAATPTGTYFPFIEKYLNFPVWIRICVLQGGKYLLALFGYQTVVTNDFIKSSEGHVSLQMLWACCGISLKCLWIAFVCAHKMPVKQKFVWSAIGVATIYLLNCIRVTLMMIAMWEEWPIARYFNTNAHDFFNYLCYAALLGLTFVFYRYPKDKNQSPRRVDTQLNQML